MARLTEIDKDKINNILVAINEDEKILTLVAEALGEKEDDLAIWLQETELWNRESLSLSLTNMISLWEPNTALPVRKP